MLSPLSPEGRRIVEALIGAELAWSRPDELAARSGIPIDPLLDDLAVLDAGGWIRPWEECPVGISITFTPLAAELLGIRIVEHGTREVPRWASEETPEPPPPKASGVFRSFGTLGLVVDPSPSPEDLAILAEQIAEAEARRDAARKPSAWDEARARSRCELARRKREAKRRTHATEAGPVCR